MEEELEENHNREITAPMVTRSDEMKSLNHTNFKIHPRTLEKAKCSILGFLRDARNPKARSMYNIFCHFSNRFSTDVLCETLRDLLSEDRVRCKRDDKIGGGHDPHVDHWFFYNAHPKPNQDL